MTKADIINAVAKQTGMEKVAVTRVIQGFMGSVRSSLQQGKNVYLRGFGSFVVKRRAEKVARNISKKAPITIPAHNVPAFKASKAFVNEVKGGKKKGKK